jgi:hypothetical protein
MVTETNVIQDLQLWNKFLTIVNPLNKEFNDDYKLNVETYAYIEAALRNKYKLRTAHYSILFDTVAPDAPKIDTEEFRGLLSWGREQLKAFGVNY